jgi:hypothetical protein
MRHLLAVLRDGTHGTSAEPAGVAARAPQDGASDQRLATAGTLGTPGTRQNGLVGPHDVICQQVRDLTDTWHERMAICLEAGDIGEAEAEITAALEVGRAFVCHFVTDQPGGGRK